MPARNSRMILTCSIASVLCTFAGACKPAASRVPRGGDLESYLAALESNESELRAAGVMVARAEPPAASPVAAAPRDQEILAEAEPEPEPDADADADLVGGAPDAKKAMESEERMMVTEAAAEAPPARERKELAKRERRSDARDRCERICDLAEMACELEARICELAQEHEGEARYADACERAQQQCDSAAEACRTCA